MLLLQWGLVIWFLLETLPYPARGTPRGCLPSGVTAGLEGRHWGTQCSGRLAHLTPHVATQTEFGPNIPITSEPVSPSALLPALTPPP